MSATTRSSSTTAVLVLSLLAFQPKFLPKLLAELEVLLFVQVDEKELADDDVVLAPSVLFLSSLWLCSQHSSTVVVVELLGYLLDVGHRTGESDSQPTGVAGMRHGDASRSFLDTSIGGGAGFCMCTIGI